MATKRGWCTGFIHKPWWGKGLARKKKIAFLKHYLGYFKTLKKGLFATKLEGGGGMALVATKKNCGSP